MDREERSVEEKEKRDKKKIGIDEKIPQDKEP